MANLTTLNINDTGFIKLPTGNGNERSSSPQEAELRFNNNRNSLENFTSTSWRSTSDRNQQPIVTSGLELYYDFGNPDCYDGESNAVLDLAGNNDGSLLNIQSFVSESDGCLSFNGTTSRIEFPNLSIGNDFTFSAWVKPNDFASNSSNDLGIIGTTSSNRRQFDFNQGSELGVTTRLRYFDATLSDSAAEIEISSYNLIDKWLHVCVTRRSDITRLYLNGICILNVVQTGTTNTFIDQIGTSNPSGDQYFDGLIANVQIYNRQLSEEEVIQNFQAFKDRFDAYPLGGSGMSPTDPAPSAYSISAFNPTAENGFYYIKTPGSPGNPAFVYCDLDGEESGIGPGWIRIEYADNYYSRSSAWGGTGNSNQSNPPTSQEFFFEYSDAEVETVIYNAEDIRQRFIWYGINAVGWTYQAGNIYMSHVGFNGLWYGGSRGGTGTHIVYDRPDGVNFGPFTSYTEFPNSPSSDGTDPNDANNSTWRGSVFYFQDKSGKNVLPIKNIRHADVDSGSEQAYFPLRDGDDGTGTPDGDASTVWVKTN